jgi:hypothetical protein
MEQDPSFYLGNRLAAARRITRGQYNQEAGYCLLPNYGS